MTKRTCMLGFLIGCAVGGLLAYLLAPMLPILFGSSRPDLP